MRLTRKQQRIFKVIIIISSLTLVLGPFLAQLIR